MDEPSEGALFRRICFFPKDFNLHAGMIHSCNFFLVCLCKDNTMLLSDTNMQLK